MKKEHSTKIFRAEAIMPSTEHLGNWWTLLALRTELGDSTTNLNANMKSVAIFNSKSELSITIGLMDLINK